MLQRTHHHVRRRVTWYDRWHEHRYHPHVHAAITVAIALFAGLAIAMQTATLAGQTTQFQLAVVGGAPSTELRDERREVVADPVVPVTETSRKAGTCPDGEDLMAVLSTDESGRIYISNPSASEGWVLTVGPTKGITSGWEKDGRRVLDIADDGGEVPGCGDGDGDGLAGQLTIDPSAARIRPDCARCRADQVRLGPKAGLNMRQKELTLADATGAAVGRWYLEGIVLRQTVPGRANVAGASLVLTLTLVSR